MRTLEQQDFVYSLTQKGMYERIFAIFLNGIKNSNWVDYFIKEMVSIQSNTIVTYGYEKSHYSNGKMSISHTEAVLDDKVIIHEYGHFIFDDRVSNEESAIITDIFKREVSSLIEDEEYLVKLHQRFSPSVNWVQFCHNRRYCPMMLTDGISILTGKASVGISHHSDYPIEHLATELFAEVLETEVVGYKIPLAIYETQCPKTYSYIKNKIYEVLDI